MKKLTALVLALILALAAIPALGEEFTGSWYLNMVGMTVGTLELAADGTITGEMTEEAISGTWEATDNGVQLTIEGETVALIANEAGLATEDNSLSMTREPAKVTIQDFAVYLQTGELPEGVTEEEMLEILNAMFGAEEEEAAPAEEAAAEVEAAAEEAVAEVEAAAEEVAAEAEAAAEEAAEPALMSYEEYAAAPIDAEVYILTYVQATQSWWNNAITVYAQSPDGAYFIYNMGCSEEVAAKLVPGTPIYVKGYKAEWGGEVEIADAGFLFAEEGTEPFIAEAEDVTAKIGTDELINDMNKKVVFKGMTIDGPISYKDDKVGEDDIYFTASKDGQAVSFCVEFYLTGADTEVYQAVAALNAGDVVDIEAYLYWYEGANPHVIGVTPAE